MEVSIRTKIDIQACILTFKVITKNYLDWSTKSGTTHVIQSGKLGSSTNEMSESHETWYLGLYTNFKYDSQRLF